RTPRHNGKVERSHRNDNERFYSRLSFYSYEDLLVQMKRYVYKSNQLPMQTLDGSLP
ncbi:MAG: IS481 family transposase, partial [Peptoniphilaceae bacterium]|nr:IS481 family transposase [Peptoniphilaceae bacterium]